jgi:tRNA-uridine 2-sulfurtransferase
MEKILLGLSGGVDSAYAALSLMESGYEVIGLHMQFYQDPRSQLEREQALIISKKLGFNCYTLDCILDFENKVINNFVEGYLSGVTPNPCLSCNYHFKYSKMIEIADKHNIDKIALGHYAEIAYEPSLGHHVLKKSKNMIKDQSYLLYGIQRKDLSRFKLPMKTINDKSTVIDYIKCIIPELNHIKESQDICFVGNKNYPGYIIKKSGIKAKPGYFTDLNGQKIGKHKGIIYYTTGQKKGLSREVPGGMRVIKINASKNEIVIGPEEYLFYRHIEIEKPNILVPGYLEYFPLKVKTSQWGLEYPCIIKDFDFKHMTLDIPSGIRAPEKGQGAVIYHEDIVVAGGIISKIK